MKGNNFQGVIMQGVGLLFIGISTIFFSVLIGFFKTLTSSSGTLAPWVGLPQVVPVTPLIIWVVMILLGVVAIGAGEKSMLEKPGKYADFMLIGIGMLFLGISVVFFSVTLGFFASLMSTSGLAAFTGLAQIIPVTPLIIWVMIMILSVVNIGAGGVRIAKKNGLLGGTQTPTS
jgi:hypothetical protein